MRTIFTAFLLAISIFPGPSKASTFILYDMNRNETIVSEGDPDERFSPRSTFKVALSLMGFESKILHNESAPTFKFKPEHEPEAVLEAHRQDLTPANWIKYSCVWFSQDLTKALGKAEFQRYIGKLSYGNQDVSGDPGKDNGLTHSWLDSSLRISAQEQVLFMSDLARQKLPFAQHAQQMTRNIMNLGDQGNGWTLYGKTGSGFYKNTDGSKNRDRGMGWFVGWIEKGDQKYAFALHIDHVEKEQGYGGPVAKAAAIERLKKLVIDKNPNL